MPAAATIVVFDRRFDVWKYVNNTRKHVGIVKATCQTLADRKATTLFGRGVWTTERD